MSPPPDSGGYWWATVHEILWLYFLHPWWILQYNSVDGGLILYGAYSQTKFTKIRKVIPFSKYAYLINIFIIRVNCLVTGMKVGKTFSNFTMIPNNMEGEKEKKRGEKLFQVEPTPFLEYCHLTGLSIAVTFSANEWRNNGFSFTLSAHWNNLVPFSLYPCQWRGKKI